jgi:WXG100 family type VII secretion target
MLPTKVRADYDELAEIAETFQHQAETTRQTYRQLNRDKADLEGGAWIGQGAQKLYNEMDSAVLPTMDRLINSLERASQITGTISRIMKQAETDAAAVLGAVPTGGPGDDGQAGGSGGSHSAPGTSGGSHAGGASTGSAGGAGAPGGSQPVPQIVPGFPANFSTAWNQFQQLDQPVQAGEAAQFGGSPNLSQSVLSRLQSLPNTRVSIAARFASVRDPSEAGGTTVKATLPDGRVFYNTGFGGNADLVTALNALSLKERAEVQFNIQIEAKVPKYLHQRTPLMATDAYFLETLTHEFAIHGEKYADTIRNYQAGQPWAESTEYADHQELLYGANLRFMLWTRRLHDDRNTSAAAGTLWSDYRASLAEDAKTLNTVAPTVPGARPLGWLQTIGIH